MSERGRPPSKSPAAKVASKQTKKKTKEKRSRSVVGGRFELLPDFRTGDEIPNQPETFSCELRLLRRLLRWVKRYGVLQDGTLTLYSKQQDIERKKPWREIDLAHSVVSFRDADQRIVINTLEESPDLYRLQVDKEKFKRFMKEIRHHRLYRQSKLRPSELPLKALTDIQLMKSPTSQPANARKDTQIGKDGIAELEASLAKLEDLAKQDLKSLPTDVEKVHKEYLVLAKQVYEKLRSSHEHRTVQSPKKPTFDKPHSLYELVPQEQPKVIRGPLTESAKAQVQPIPAVTPREALMKLLQTTPTPEPAAPTTQATPSVPPLIRTPPLAIAAPTQSTSEDETVDSPPKKKSTKIQPVVPLPVTETAPASPIQVPPVAVIDQKAKVEEEPEKSIEEESEIEVRTPPKMSSYRRKLPAPMGPAPSLFRLLLSAVGRDTAHLSLPCASMEPLGLLQMLCEELEYSELIRKTIASKEPSLRMAYVAALAVSAYGQTCRRIGRKPFNPLLGETYEFQHPDFGWKYVAEKVCQRPSVLACYAEGPGWRFWQDRQFFVTFGGNSAEAKCVGMIYLRLDKWNETYCWTKVTSNVTGLMGGRPVVDHYGELIVSCEQTGVTAKLHFKKATKQVRGDINGKILGRRDKVLEKVHGNWTNSLYVGEGSDERRLWLLDNPLPDAEKYYGFSKFAMALNEYRPDIQGTLPKTDSRFRPDQKALEMGQPDAADKIKVELEARQRQRRKESEDGTRPYKPLWFKETGNKDGTRGSLYKFTGTYWKAKKKKFEMVSGDSYKPW